MNYWVQRNLKSQNKLSDKTVKSIEKQLRKYYGTSAEKILGQFEKTYNKLISSIDEGKKPTPADLYKLDAYWKMQGQVREELQKLGEKQVVALTKAFEMNFFEVYYSLNLPNNEVGEAFSMIDNAMVHQMINSIWCADGKSWSQRIWENNDLLMATLNDELIHCVAAGKKTTELKQLLQNRFNVSYGRADALVRTEIAHIQTQAAQKRYEDYGIKEVQVWADEDERRCPVCGKLHEKKYPIGAAMPIPAHPRCRCTIVPVVE